MGPVWVNTNFLSVVMEVEVEVVMEVEVEVEVEGARAVQRKTTAGLGC